MDKIKISEYFQNSTPLFFNISILPPQQISKNQQLRGRRTSWHPSIRTYIFIEPRHPALNARICETRRGTEKSSARVKAASTRAFIPGEKIYRNHMCALAVYQSDDVKSDDLAVSRLVRSRSSNFTPDVRVSIYDCRRCCNSAFENFAWRRMRW